MSDSGDIPVFIRNPDGEYLAEQGGEWRFTSDRSRAHVFGYHADEVAQQLEQAQRDLGVIWIAYPVAPSLILEICAGCGRKLLPTDAIFTGTHSLCPGCSASAGS
jgi:hypothetical protein